MHFLKPDIVDLINFLYKSLFLQTHLNLMNGEKGNGIIGVEIGVGSATLKSVMQTIKEGMKYERINFFFFSAGSYVP